MAEFEEFISYVKGRQGEQLPTVGGQSTFAVVVSDDGLIYTPLRTNQPRKQKYAVAKQVFDRFRNTGSLRPTDYKDLTYHASYLLALIDCFDVLAQGTAEAVTPEDPEAIEGMVKEKRYLARHRNRHLAETRKSIDSYTCQVCGVGLIAGKSIVECHHLVAVAYAGTRVTKLDDLATLCPSCHRIAHLRSPPFTLAEIRSLLDAADPT